MSRPRYTIAFVMLVVITTNHCCYVVATSSSSSSSSSLSVNGQALPSKESSIQDSNANSVQPPIPSNTHPQVVTFLYELYEHEIYNPNTGSWGSRRFTQSRESGGGGRDYQSLDPQTCSPPRGTVFEGEWKIDVKGTGETRDGFGWEYYVGKYDGLGRRRRRWLRNLRRVGGARARSSSSAYYNQMLRRSRTDPTKAKTTTTTTTSSPISNTNTKHKHPLSNKSTQSTGILKGFQQQYHFQGFGWSFFKSLLSKRSMGASLRIPISANFDFYDKKLAWPVITTTTYFGYPWVVATFLNASLPIEAIKWFIGGIMWKITWVAAILSACLRGIAEVIFSILMLPWTIFQAFVQMTRYVKARLYKIFVYETEDQKIAQSLMESVGGEDESDVDATIVEKNETNVESYIELSTTSSRSNSKNGTDDGELVSVPRGGASGRTTAKNTSAKRKRKKYVTLFGHEIPKFNRANSIEYSTTISERVGICVSWRVSQEHGYEYRWNFFYSCLPTLDFWGQVDEARRRKIDSAYRKVGFWGVKKQKTEKGTSSSSPSSSSNSTCTEMEKSEKAKSVSPQSSSRLYSFLEKHKASLGYSAGWPLPVDPYFSFSILLSLSGFYYAWLLKFVRTVFLLGAKSSKLKEDENSSESELLTEARPAPSARTAEKSSAVKCSSKSDLSKEADIANDETESESAETIDETESEDEEGLSVSKMESEESSDDTTKMLIKRNA